MAKAKVCRNCGASWAYRNPNNWQQCQSCGCKHGFFRPASSKNASLQKALELTDIRHPLQANILCELIGIPGTKLRELVHEARMNGAPIGSGPKGYYLAREPDHLDFTIEHGMSRAAKIQEYVLALQQTKRFMRLGDERWKEEAFSEPSPPESPVSSASHGGMLPPPLPGELSPVPK